MSRPAGDFATRIVVWGMAILSGLLLMWAKDFLEVHHDLDRRIGAVERQASGLQLQMDLILKHHAASQGRK